METEIDLKNGILYIRVSGVLVGNKVNKFECEVLPIVLSLESKYVTINLKDVDLIDSRGINSLIKVADSVNKFKGKVVLCDLNEYIKEIFKHSDIFDYCYKSSNEKTSVGVFSI